MNKYAIFYYKNTDKGTVKYFLQNIGGNYGPATNLTFNSPDHAVQFLKVYKNTPVATMIFIQGPKKGIYSSFSGKLLK